MVALSPANAGEVAEAPRRRKMTPSRLIMLSPGRLQRGVRNEWKQRRERCMPQAQGSCPKYVTLKALSLRDMRSREQLYPWAENEQAKVGC
jgi:hypothetical protein